MLFFPLVSLLSGCKFALLNPKGLIAADEKHLMLIAVFLMLTIVIPVIILSFIFAWRYRAGNTQAEYQPNWSHSTLIEVICWSVPCVIVAILGVLTWTSTYRLDPYKSLISDKQPIIIQAISLEWRWLFIYPDYGIATINFVQFPVDTPVRFLITSEGPMNSLQIPQLAGQIYAMAGMQTKLNLIANSLGEYRGVSANFTGEGFSDMQFNVRVSSQKEFYQWVNQAKQSSEKLSLKMYSELMKQNRNNSVRYFSLLDKNIFETAIMKSMMPMPKSTNELATK